MSTLSTIYAIAFYVATLVLVVGVARKIMQYARTPAPLKIPTTPAPVTKQGVVWRMFTEVAFFNSLFRSNKWIWIFGWMFHFALLLVLLRHGRYFVEPGFIINVVQPFGKYASYAMVIGLGGLWARRFLVDRVRYISSLSDHLILALLVSIGVTGILMKFVWHTDIVSLKMFIDGLFAFNIQPLPGDPLLLIHLALVILLMLIFPISKLLHAPGVFFSPTRNQVDNPRERRHLANWAVKLDETREQR